MSIDITAYNKAAWNMRVESGNRWTVPVSTELIAEAGLGNWDVLLTPTKPVPHSWFPEMHGADVLGLASGGGQQCPIFAAAGANVTVLDNSPRQLEQDRIVAEREGFSIRTVEGDMADLSVFSDESFDLVFNPCSNCFAPDVRAIWRESARVLRHGGILLTGFNNPILYSVDQKLEADGIVQLVHTIPYSDLTSRAPEDLKAFIANGEVLEFGHTLADQIGGQLDAGLVMTAIFEDNWGESRGVVDRLMDVFIATRAIKP